MRKERSYQTLALNCCEKRLRAPRTYSVDNWCHVMTNGLENALALALKIYQAISCALQFETVYAHTLRSQMFHFSFVRCCCCCDRCKIHFFLQYIQMSINGTTNGLEEQLQRNGTHILALTYAHVVLMDAECPWSICIWWKRCEFNVARDAFAKRTKHTDFSPQKIQNGKWLSWRFF